MITEFLQLQAQLKIFHWSTFSFAQHKALGQAYDALDDLTDTFVEQYFGQYGRLVDKEYNIQLVNLDKNNILPFVEKYIDFVKGDLVKELDPIVDTNLLNIRDDILGQLQHLKYLLSLS